MELLFGLLNGLTSWVRQHRWTLLLLLVATVLWWPDAAGRSSYAEHELWRDLDVLRLMAAGEQVWLGPRSSLGAFHFGPAFYYLSYPLAALLDFAPYALAVSSLLSSLATLVLLGALVRRWFGSKKMAVTVMALYATSNLSLQIAKYGSNPNFVPLFSVLFFMAFERLLAGEKAWRHWALLGVSLGVLVQLHAVPLLTSPLVIVAALALRWLRPTARGSLVFMASAALTVAPWLLPDARNGFANIAQLFVIVGSPLVPSVYVLRLVDIASFVLSPILSLHGFFNVAMLWGARFLFGVVAVTVGFLVAFFSESRDRTPVPTDVATPAPSVRRAVLLWAIVPVAVLLLPVGGLNNLQIYYFFPALPLTYVGYAYALHRAWADGWRRCAMFAVAAFAVAQAAQFVTYHSLIRLL